MQLYEHGSKYYDKKIKYDLSENINPLGMPPSVKKVIANCPEAFSKYPDSEYLVLRESIALHMGVDISNVCLGNGADELIWKIMQVFKPERILELAPTFSEYARSATAIHAVVDDYLLEADNDFVIGEDFLKKMDRGYDMVFLCNPNNPTGKVIPRKQLEGIARKALEVNSIVVIDESFLDFTDEISMASCINEFENLIIIRGFTKIYGMAGIRLGYMIGSPKHTLRIKEYGPLWNVSSVAMLTGQAALDEDNWIEQTKRYISNEKEYIYRNIPDAIKSDANFILIKTSESMADRLYEKGIAVRKCENFSGLDYTYIRVGIKSHECNKAFVDAYKEITNG